MKYRKEKDSLGEIKVPNKAMYGGFTVRALLNFQISGTHIDSDLLRAMAYLKKACAMANFDLGMLNEKKTKAICFACDQIIQGKYDHEFPLEYFQAGAGTPFNMNINEVIANVGLKKMRKKLGDYKYLHPNNDVNMGQSTNNFIPSAVKVACLFKLENFFKVLEDSEKIFSKLSKKHKDVLKVGRTHMQDAVPITYGQVFDSYRALFKRGKEGLDLGRNQFLELGIGGNAIGTSINTPPRFRKKIVSYLNFYLDEKFRVTNDPIYLTSFYSCFASFSNRIKELVIDLEKLCNDLILLSSGPNTGLNEIELPEVEPGSSIMPGKVNPSMVECLKMACLQVYGNMENVNRASSQGQLELNVMAPVIAYNLFFSLETLGNAIEACNEKCFKGIKVNKKVVSGYFEDNKIIVTLLNPYIGYQVGAELVKIALKSNQSIRDVILSEDLMPEKTLEKLFKPDRLTNPAKFSEKLKQEIENHAGFKKFLKRNKL